MIIIFLHKLISLIYSIKISIPLHILNVFLFAIISFLIELTFVKVYNFIWKKSLDGINIDLLDKKLFYKLSKHVFISNAESEYLKNNNNFFIELAYFLFTILIIFIGLKLENNYLILLFFIIKTTRKLLIANTINQIALAKIQDNDFEEQLCHNIYLLYDNDFIKLFKLKEGNISNDLVSLEFKFKELAMNNNLNKEILIDLINSQKITSKNANMIDLEYSKLIKK